MPTYSRSSTEDSRGTCRVHSRSRESAAIVDIEPHVPSLVSFVGALVRCTDKVQQAQMLKELDPRIEAASCSRCATKTCFEYANYSSIYFHSSYRGPNLGDDRLGAI